MRCVGPRLRLRNDEADDRAMRQRLGGSSEAQARRADRPHPSQLTGVRRADPWRHESRIGSHLRQPPLYCR